MTMYYDMSQMNNNENYLAVFDTIKNVLMTDERLSLFVEQNKNGQISEDELRRTLIFENPKIEPYAYKLQGMVGKIDAERTRLSFDCVFKDLRKDSVGRI